MFLYKAAAVVLDIRFGSVIIVKGHFDCLYRQFVDEDLFNTL